MFMSGGRLSGAFCEVAKEGDLYRASVVIGIAEAF